MLADNTKTRNHDYESGCWQTTLKLAIRERLCSTVVLLSSLFLGGNAQMQSYTLEEARRIVMQCAKQYKANLLDKQFILIYRDRNDNQVKSLKLVFEKGNYQHLTGIELIDEYYVPVSALLEDIKQLTNVQSQVLAILSKELTEDTYSNIRHAAKGLNLNNLTISDDIMKKISLENYVPKEK